MHYWCQFKLGTGSELVVLYHAMLSLAFQQMYTYIAYNRNVEDIHRRLRLKSQARNTQALLTVKQGEVDENQWKDLTYMTLNDGKT